MAAKRRTSLKYQKSFFVGHLFFEGLSNIFYEKLGYNLEKKTLKRYAILNTNTGFLFKLNSNFSSFFQKGKKIEQFLITKKDSIFQTGQSFKLGERGSFAAFRRNQYNYVKSSGSYFTVISKDNDNLIVKLPSGKIKKFPLENFFKKGANPFPEKSRINYGSAGFKLHLLGGKSKVRGVAKNPVDHPHGGGEGKKSGIKKSPQG